MKILALIFKTSDEEAISRLLDISKCELHKELKVAVSPPTKSGDPATVALPMCQAVGSDFGSMLISSASIGLDRIILARRMMAERLADRTGMDVGGFDITVNNIDVDDSDPSRDQILGCIEHFKTIKCAADEAESHCSESGVSPLDVVAYAAEMTGMSIGALVLHTKAKQNALVNDIFSGITFSVKGEPGKQVRFSRVGKVGNN